MSSSSASGQISSDVYIDWKGQIFNNRYISLKKLGYGGCSSVWFCYDTFEDRSIALKIFNLDDYNHGTYEVEILKKINSLKSQLNVKFYESFDHETKDGVHLCISLELMKTSLYQYCKENYLNLKEIKIITKQILEFLVCINKASLVHTDIKPENILINDNSELAYKIKEFMKSPKYTDNLLNKKRILLKHKKNDIKKVGINAIKELLLEEFSEILNNKNSDTGDSSSDNSSDSSSESSSNYIEKKDKYVFTHDFLSDDSEELDDSEKESKELKESKNNLEVNIYAENIKVNKIKITDFNTCLSINKPDYEIQTRYYRAPEVILENNFSEKIDIWSLGCTLYELLTREILINPDDIKDFSDDRYHIYLIHKKIGIFDNEFWNKSKNKYIYLDSNNLLRGFNEIKSEPFWDLLINKFGSNQELLHFIDFLLDCLEINPIKRKTAEQLLNHVFLQKI
jgi:serine/threonine-protein kinase SRPK3